MANSREEQLRNNRRLARQLVGAVALILVVIGLFTVLNWCVAALREALGGADCREIAPRLKTRETRCLRTVELAADALEAYLKENGLL